MTASEKTIPTPQVAARNGAAIGAAKLAENAPVRIDAHDVDFYYSDFHALKKITMPLYDRRITALIGPSGCGKSTFLRCLNRMNDEIDGTRVVGKITLDNIDINGAGVDKPELRKRIGMVFQKANPFPMSIYDNIAFGPRLHGRPDRKSLDDLVQRCLEQAALWQEVKDKLKASAFALSGGQMQRLCIARTLATQPEVILMDEPTSALDPASTQKIEEMMETLKRDYTIVIVTHNMQQAARISDYTGFFYKGELIEFGSTDRLFTSPQNKQTEDYIRGRFG